MTTGTAGSTARRFHTQQVHYLRFDVLFNDTDVATGNGKQWLPANAILIGTDVMVNTIFNAATTNVLTVGTNSTSYDNILAAGDVAEGTAALTKDVSPTGTALGKLAADVQVFAKYTQTGTAATTGSATVMIKFTVANDL